MQIIDEMIQELTDYSTEYNTGDISKEELNLKLQLIISRIQELQIDYSHSPFVYLPADVLKVFTNLLNRYKAKATVSLTTLIEANSKASYNRKARHLIEKKLYFQSLFTAINRNITGWTFRNNTKYPTGINYFTVGNSHYKDGAVNE